MLDASRNAKLGDFGLARLVDHGAERRTTVGLHRSGVRQQPQALRRVGRVQLRRGATGDRPYVADGQLCRRGEPPRCWALSVACYDRGNVLDAADERLNGVFDERQMQRVLVIGLWCACHDATRRPSRRASCGSSACGRRGAAGASSGEDWCRAFLGGITYVLLTVICPSNSPRHMQQRTLLPVIQLIY